MKPLSSDNFGLLIAYLLPGFIVIWGLRPFFPELAAWFGESQTDAPTIGGFLYVTLGSTAAGLIVSTVRWAVVDKIYHKTGIIEPRWNFGKFAQNIAAFQSFVEDHYRYYQFYANAQVAILAAYTARLIAEKQYPWQAGWQTVLLFGTSSILILGSRDALRKYYARTAAVLGEEPATSKKQTITPDG